MDQNLATAAKEQELVRFDHSDQAKPSVLNLISEETRRIYETHIKEFFHFHNLKHPLNITATDVIRWCDALLKKKVVLRQR